MENVKREELEKLVGTDKVNIFYKIVDEITLLYNILLQRKYVGLYDYFW